MLPTLYPPKLEGTPSFFEPGDGKGYLETLSDWTPSLAGVVRLGVAAGSPEGQELTSAAASNSALNRYLSSRDRAIEEAADLRIDAIRRATGVELQNPYRNGYGVEARDRVRARRFDADFDPREGIPGAARDIFNERVADVIAKHGDKVADLDLQTPIEEKARTIATSAEDALPGVRARTAAGGMSVQQQTILEGAGSLGASLKDPLTLFSLAAGPGLSVGRTAVMRVLTEAAGQGGFNVGLLLAEHPVIDAWRQERGKESAGHLPTLQETAIAFAAGAIPGAGTRLASELLARVRPDIGPAVIAAGERSAEADRMVAEAIPARVMEAPPKLVVARKLPDGSVQYGKRGDIHSDLLSEADISAMSDVDLNNVWQTQMGFAEPGGAFMTRGESSAWIKVNEPGRAHPEFSANMGMDLHASHYQEWAPYDTHVSRETGEAALTQAARHDADPLHEPPPPQFETPPATARDERPPSQIVAAETPGERAAQLADLVRRVDNDPVEVVESMRAIRELGDGGAVSGNENLVNAAKMASLSEPAWQAVKDGRASPQHALIVAEHAPNPSDHVPVLERLEREAPQTPKEARVIAADEVAGQATKSEVAALVDRVSVAAEVTPRAPSLQDRVVDAYQQATGGKFNKPVSLAELRRILADVPREALDAELKRMHVVEELHATLSGNDNPASITAADRAASMKAFGGDKYVLWMQAPAEKPRMGSALDPMDTTPTPANDGTTLLLSREETAARLDGKQSLADLVRACKE